MPIFRVDSVAHYTTPAQGGTKVLSVDQINAGAGAFGDPATRGHWRDNFVAVTTLEISCYFLSDLAPGGGFAGQSLLLEANNGTGNQITIQIFSDGHLRFWRGNITFGTILGSSASNVIQANVQHHFYFKFVISSTVGTIDWKVDGVSQFSLSPQNTSNQGNPELTQLDLYQNGGSLTWSEIALASASGDITGQPRVQAIFPRAAGNYAAWTVTGGGGVSWTAVSETTPDDDTSYIASATVGQRASALYTPLLAAATTILAVAVVPRTRKDDAAARVVGTFVRAAAVDYDFVTTHTVGASYGYNQDVMPTNPATGIAWTVAEVNALEAGVRVVQ